MNQAWENDQKRSFGPNFGPFHPILVPKNFLRVLPLLDVIHCCKLSLYEISRKTNEPNLRKWQKTSFWTWLWPLCWKFGSRNFFSWVLPLLNVRHCCKLSLHAISKKTNELNVRKLQKTKFWVRFWPIWSQFGLPFFFQKSGSASH